MVLGLCSLGNLARQAPVDDLNRRADYLISVTRSVAAKTSPTRSWYKYVPLATGRPRLSVPFQIASYTPAATVSSTRVFTV